MWMTAVVWPLNADKCSCWRPSQVNDNFFNIDQYLVIWVPQLKKKMLRDFYSALSTRFIHSLQQQLFMLYMTATWENQKANFKINHTWPNNIWTSMPWFAFMLKLFSAACRRLVISCFHRLIGHFFQNAFEVFIAITKGCYSVLK